MILRRFTVDAFEEVWRSAGRDVRKHHYFAGIIHIIKSTGASSVGNART